MKTFDVAISFSTDDYLYAKEVYTRLENRNLKVYHYIHKQEETLGTELKSKLQTIYSNSTIVVIIHSENYLTEYTKIELDAALTGNSSKEGIIPVKLDESPLPNAIDKRTFWNYNLGSDPLVELILKRLKKSSSSEFRTLLLVPLISAVSILYLTIQLGFSKFNRLLDIILVGLSLSPILWFLIYNVFPDQIKKYRLSKLKGDNLLQSPIERVIDRSRNTLRTLAFSVTVLMIITATFQREKILFSHNEFVNFNSSISTEFENQTKLLKDIATKVSAASMKVLPSDLDLSIRLDKEIGSLSDSLKQSNNAILELIKAQNLNIPDSISIKYIDNIAQCDRIIEKYILYQLNELTKDKSYLGFDSWLRNRGRVSKILINYNSLFAKNILLLDESFIQLRESIIEKNIELRKKWQGVIQ